MDDRIAGCLVGGAVGDALGGPYEGQAAPAVRFDGRPWAISDDTQLTLATCEAIVEAGGVVDPEKIAARFATWFTAGRVTGVGASTYKALSELSRGGHWALVGRRGEMVAGNGAAMRAAPLGFVLGLEHPDARRTLRDVCRITHHNEEAYVGALAIAMAVRAAASGDWGGEDDLLRLVSERLPDSLVRDRLEEMSGIRQGLPFTDVAKRFGNSGWVVESVPLAMYATRRVTSLGFEATLVELVGTGGDTDTIASMAGQIMGARIGRSALPQELLARLPELDTIESTIGEFSTVLSRSSIRYPSRPE